ncbi:hypothetical protein D5R81_08860 [Parashewanella spongiae]|uniref:Uncharacterized protein n=1 Tax=Parashewanella spongiae TaxID=342950 RepID=A0A3A6TVI5_9GAMM|nr:hypothetical protein [Parashewanella spongiae]MCL1078348.1 hypothetical protein [Parashewanella spongiae]RJY16893.1 hypothetical protein D5R81_08860 [Parashewanella spongiae]
MINKASIDWNSKTNSIVKGESIRSLARIAKAMYVQIECNDVATGNKTKLSFLCKKMDDKWTLHSRNFHTFWMGGLTRKLEFRLNISFEKLNDKLEQGADQISRTEFQTITPAQNEDDMSFSEVDILFEGVNKYTVFQYKDGSRDIIRKCFFKTPLTDNEVEKPSWIMTELAEFRREFRLRQQDVWALEVLSSEENKRLVCELAVEVVEKLKCYENEFNKKLFGRYVKKMLQKVDMFPTPIEFMNEKRPTNTGKLIQFCIDLINSERVDKHIMLLATQWRVVLFLLVLTDPALKKLIDYDYHNVISPSRDHIKDRNIRLTNHSYFFGNTQISDPDGLMNGLKPQLLLARCWKVNTNSKVAYVKSTLLSGQPYVSGPSGMANSFSAIFGLLDIDIESERGLALQKIFRAFVIGGANHSGEEVDYSFQLARNLYRKLNVQPRNIS